MDLDGASGGTVFKADLVMTNTTCSSENDSISTNTDFTTPDVCDGSGYVTKTLSTLAVTRVDASDLSKWGADNLTWTALGSSTRAIKGILIYKYVTNFAASIPVAFIQFASNKTADGSDFTVAWDGTNGILYLT